MYGLDDAPVRTASGNLASALDNITSGGLDDDFLSGGDLTIEQIHSLNTKSSGQSPALTFGSEFEARDSSISQNGFGSTITAPAFEETSYAPGAIGPGSPSESSVSVSTGLDNSAISPSSKVSHGSGNSSPFGRSQASEPDAKKPKKAAPMPRVAMLNNGSGGPSRRPEEAPRRTPTRTGTSSRAPGGSERSPNAGAGRGRTMGTATSSGVGRTTSSRSADPTLSSSPSRPPNSSVEPRPRPTWGASAAAKPGSRPAGNTSPPPAGTARRSSAPPPNARTSSTATSQPGTRRTSTAATASAGRIPAPARPVKRQPGDPAPPTGNPAGRPARPAGPAGRGAASSKLPRGPGQGSAPALEQPPAPEPENSGDGEEDPLASLMELMGDIKNMKHELGMVTPKASMTEGHSKEKSSRGPSRLGPGGSGDLPSPDSTPSNSGGFGKAPMSPSSSSSYRYGDNENTAESVGATPKREGGSVNGYYTESPAIGGRAEEREDDWRTSPMSLNDGGEFGRQKSGEFEEPIPEQTPSPVADRPIVAAQPGYYPVQMLPAEEVKTKCQCACSIM